VSSFTGFTDEALRELQDLIAQASKETSQDPEVQARVKFVQQGMRWTLLEVRAHRFLDENAKVDRVEVKKVLDERYALERELFESYPLALNVGMIAWGEDAVWGKLGYQSPK